MLNIILFGAPGCGKGTQSERIIKKFGLKHFSTGDLLRNEIEKKTVLGIEADKYISGGNLVPDDMIIGIIAQAVQTLNDSYKGIIFDGFPRTVKQAEELENLMSSLHRPIKLMIDIKVPEKELIDRLLLRGKISGRTDDTLKIIQQRLDVYKAKTAPVIEFYKSLNKYSAIDGLGKIDDISKRIEKVLNSTDGFLQ